MPEDIYDVKIQNVNFTRMWGRGQSRLSYNLLFSYTLNPFCLSAKEFPSTMYNSTSFLPHENIEKRLAISS
ncbi:hypothetical protein D5274_03830 [bacterium 1XD42-94]|nr:hypothetical protein [bacterium 1XD42-76]NBK04309.1 hypothetical protein [bacterium 1XD42-94]